MKTESTTHCDFCGRSRDDGGILFSGANGTICEQCVRGMYWKVQEEGRLGRVWRALGWHRTSAEVDVRVMLAVVPSVALAWIGAPILLDHAPSLATRTVWFLTVLAITAVLTLVLMIVAEHALASRAGSKVLLWCVWLGAAAALWSPIGWTPAFVAAGAAAVLLYLILRRATFTSPSRV